MGYNCEDTNFLRTNYRVSEEEKGYLEVEFAAIDYMSLIQTIIVCQIDMLTFLSCEERETFFINVQFRGFCICAATIPSIYVLNDLLFAENRKERSRNALQIVGDSEVFPYELLDGGFDRSAGVKVRDEQGVGVEVEDGGRGGVSGGGGEAIDFNRCSKRHWSREQLAEKVCVGEKKKKKRKKDKKASRNRF